MDGFCSNQVRDYCKSCNSSNYKRHGCSKAQACLNKILHIISSIEPPPVKKPSLKSQAGGELIESNSGDEYFGGKRKGFDIDLNLSLVGPAWESGESTESLVENGVLSACSFVYKEQQEQQQEEEEKTTDGCSDITNSQVDSIQGEEEEELKRAARGDGGGGGGGGGNNDYLGLLIAAAELISSGDDNDKKKQAMMSHDNDEEDDEKNNKKWRVDEGDTSAVVRSKRGRRSQVLPHRYRDSVVLLEPRKRLKTTNTTRSRYN